MKFSAMDLFTVIFGAIAPEMGRGVQIGALNPKSEASTEGRPYIEWAYRPQDDTLLILCFPRKPGPYEKPAQEYVLPGFGQACITGANGAAALVVANGGCGNPDCTDCGSGSPQGYAGMPSFGADMNREKEPDDYIGFRPPSKK